MFHPFAWQLTGSFWHKVAQTGGKGILFLTLVLLVCWILSNYFGMPMLESAKLRSLLFSFQFSFGVTYSACVQFQDVCSHTASGLKTPGAQSQAGHWCHQPARGRNQDSKYSSERRSASDRTEDLDVMWSVHSRSMLSPLFWYHNLSVGPVWASVPWGLWGSVACVYQQAWYNDLDLLDQRHWVVKY